MSEMQPEYRQMLTQMMESQAYRELAAAHMFGYGLRFVPEKWLKFMVWHIREEAEHYEAVSKMYRKFTGEDVEPKVAERLSGKPVPFAESWVELAMAQFLYDRGGFWQLREYEESSWAPYREVIGKIVSQEEGHQVHGQNIAVPLIRQEKDRARVQGIFNEWLRQGLICLGRPGSEGNKYAVSVGLKKRDSAECIKDYMRDILPAVREAGLTLPPKERLGVELPADIDWPLD